MLEYECVRLIKLLAEPIRWRMMTAMLAESDPLTVGQLAELAGTAHFNISKHLRMLKEGGLVVTKRRGQNILCSIAIGLRSKADGRTLDLGCCAIRFDVPPKVAGSRR
jgi:DNA-binding transcriptional ArsR family regulator